MNDDEVDGYNYKDKNVEWLDYVRQDVLCTAFSYAGYCKAVAKFTGFLMKDFVSAPGLGWKYFNSLRTEEDEPMYTYDDKYMRWFVHQRIFGGRVSSLQSIL